MSEEVKNNEAQEAASTESAEVKAAPSGENKSGENRPANSRPQRSGDNRGRNYNSREGGNQRMQGQRMPRFRKKVCRFCQDKEAVIDYKNVDILKKFITDRGKILPRRITGTCAKHQRWLATAIKQSRMIALLPFIEQ